jgi:hypothetical protein
MRAQTKDQQHNFVSARAPCCDVVPRRLAHAPAPPRRPRLRPRRPRQPAVQGRAFPTRPCPEAPWSPPEPRATICLRRTGRAHHRPPVRRRCPAVRAPVEAAGPRPYLRGHAIVIAGRVRLFKAAFYPRAHHQCHSRCHDRRLSDLPFFLSISTLADTPNTSPSSHVSRSLFL